MTALLFLKASGYDTLCFEFPNNLNEQETIANLENTVKVIENNLDEATEYLSKHEMSFNLPEMSISDE